jgi:peptide/nickel transport system substrate-binding protein
VRPEDFRASVERVLRLSANLAPPYLVGIVGGQACSPRRCDLSRGIETDGVARTITIHLRRPDPEFLHKLALPLAYVLPAGTPVTMLRGRAPPGTGPYTIAAFAPGRDVRLVRNPRFRSWSAEARPPGFPDAIVVTISPDAAAQVAAVQHGRADAVVTSGNLSGQLPLAQDRALALADASHVRTAPGVTTNWLSLNVRERPFDDVRVRQALSYAIDRRRIVALAGGGGLAGLSCQMISPGLPGYAPSCPYTVDPSPGGGWSAPDLARARRLVGASGTRGITVRVWGLPKYAAVARYTGEVLRQLGYRARVHVFSDPQSFFNYVNDSRHRAQVGFTGWIGDFLTASSFFEPFTCAAFIRNSAANENISEFCDPAFDADYAAALAAQGPEANARWAALDRRLVAASPAIPLFNRRTVMLVSDRVGNAQIHLELGPLLDQFWVR